MVDLSSSLFVNVYQAGYNMMQQAWWPLGILDLVEMMYEFLNGTS